MHYCFLALMITIICRNIAFLFFLLMFGEIVEVCQVNVSVYDVEGIEYTCKAM